MFVWMDLHFPQARFGSGWRFALSSASVLYLVSYTDMICTTSGGVSRRRHELIESCSRPPTLVDCSELTYPADVLTYGQLGSVLGACPRLSIAWVAIHLGSESSTLRIEPTR